MSDQDAFNKSLKKYEEHWYAPSLQDAFEDSGLSAFLGGEAIAALQLDGIRAKLESCYESCKSPIEVMFLNALIIDHHQAIEIICKRGELVEKVVFGDDVTFLTCEPQAAVEGLHVDFLLTMWDRYLDHLGHPLRKKLIVELDGHDFHERTKEQVSRDKARDRRVQIIGLPVFRFSGSDIHKDVFKHVVECTRYLTKEFLKSEKELRASWKKDGGSSSAPKQ